MRARVLIAEDEPEIAMSLEFLLRNGGYETRIASTGDDTLQTARVFEPDLILLDVMLPKLSGLAVCAAIRNDLSRKQPKILMVTARGSAGDIARGERAGADAHLTKPFSTQELLGEVRRLLANESPQDAG